MLVLRRFDGVASTTVEAYCLTLLLFSVERMSESCAGDYTV